jgi:hypothetical protein
VVYFGLILDKRIAKHKALALEFSLILKAKLDVGAQS